MSQPKLKKTVIQEAVEEGWQIVGLVPYSTGGTLLRHNVALVLKNERGHLRRIEVNPASIPEYEGSD